MTIIKIMMLLVMEMAQVSKTLDMIASRRMMRKRKTTMMKITTQMTNSCTRMLLRTPAAKILSKNSLNSRRYCRSKKLHIAARCKIRMMTSTVITLKLLMMKVMTSRASQPSCRA